ncbi:MAG TPA: ferrochelatase [Candidatus Saccharimonadales bacterium]|nr:ferrochelatase [Candidatus Saccharimonadales bacterium]
MAQLGIVLATFGSAITSDDVPAYMASVRGGREASADLIDEFRRRYDLIGRSPLIDLTHEQAHALQTLLDADLGAGEVVVAPGMLHSDPSLASALDAAHAAGAQRIVVIVLAPQYSPIILAGYERAVAAWSAAHQEMDVHIAGAWHLIPEWIAALAERVTEALAQVDPAVRDTIPIIFTAHSLPRPVVDRDPGYITQLHDTATSVACALDLDASRWSFAYQSAGHTPEEWLTPDVKDLFPGFRDSGVTEVLIVPLQFLADHLEILYDIDIAAQEEAVEAGITMHRIALPNTQPAFIRALAAVVERERAGVASTAAS